MKLNLTEGTGIQIKSYCFGVMVVEIKQNRDGFLLMTLIITKKKIELNALNGGSIIKKNIGIFLGSGK